MSLCPEAAKRLAMTDGEFWEYVSGGAGPNCDCEPDPEDEPSLSVGDCIRCGSMLLVDDYEHARKIIDEDCEVCDGCADELLPDVDAMEPAA